MKVQLILFAIVSFAFVCDASYFAWRAMRERRRERPVTCKIEDLTHPPVEWGFQANLSCGARGSVDTNRPRYTALHVGHQCTYTYSCPFDAPGPQRSTTLVCGSKGKWDGDMPDCSEDEALAAQIVEIFKSRIVTPQTSSSGDREEESGEEEEEEERKEATRTRSQFGGAPVRKSAQSKSDLSNLTKYCNKDRMCRSLRSIRDCRSVVPKTKRYMPVLSKVLTGLCFYCYKTYCTGQSVVLI